MAGLCGLRMRPLHIKPTQLFVVSLPKTFSLSDLWSFRC
jgi:hypothetical protein